jgi:prepilin-type N-terminal cleavage/methylation domain-containing protein
MRPARGEDGFTLIEIIVTMTLLAFVFATFSIVIASTVKHSAVITNESVLQTELRDTVNQFTKDLREATTHDPSDTSPFVSTDGTMSSTELTFYAPDSTYIAGSPSSYHLREISYQLSDGNFQRASSVSSNLSGPPWTIPALPDYVTQLGGVVNSVAFTYYDGSNPPVTTTDPAAVRTVVVTLTVVTGGSPSQYTYSGSATLRETPPT